MNLPIYSWTRECIKKQPPENARIGNKRFALLLSVFLSSSGEAGSMRPCTVFA